MPVPVVSIGNVSVGGTGKTPFVQFVVRELLALGKRPAVVSRGYGRSTRREVVVSDGATVFASVRDAGDEVLLHAEMLSVPVVANADKVAGARTAIERLGAEVVVVDDGFQHRRLARDCDIVLVDRATIERPVLLPVGRLREPLSSLRRADIVCCVGDVVCRDISSAVLGNAVCIEARIACSALRDAATHRELDGTRLGRTIAVAGIAQPERFRQSLAGVGVVPQVLIAYADHYNYREKDAWVIVQRCMQEQCPIVATTEKDAVKLRAFLPLFQQAGVQLVALPITMGVTSGYSTWREKLEQLF